MERIKYSVIVYSDGDFDIVKLYDNKVGMEEVRRNFNKEVKFFDDEVYFLVYKGGKLIGFYRQLYNQLIGSNLEPITDKEIVNKVVDFLKSQCKFDKADELLVTSPMTDEEIERYLRVGDNLDYLYRQTHLKLSESQIDRAIEMGKWLNILYSYRALTKKQIDKAIRKGEYLLSLYEHQYLTKKQKEIIEELLDKQE